MDNKLEKELEKLSKVKKIVNECMSGDRKFGEFDDVDEYENPKKEKASAYTDQYGFRIDAFLVDKDKGRRR